MPSATLHTRAEPPRRVVGVVRARRELAVPALRRKPPLDVVLLRRGGAEVAGRDVHDVVREPEPADDLLLDREDAVELAPTTRRASSTRTSRPCRTGARGRCRACPCRRCPPRAGSTTNTRRSARGSVVGTRTCRRDAARRAAPRWCRRGTGRRRRRRTPARDRSGRTRPLPSCVRVRASASRRA